MTAPAIAIVDYGMGNRRSVEKALTRVGAEPPVTRDPDARRAADGLVVPGVGAFPEAMDRLRGLGLDALLHERAQAGAPLLGLCLGMQVLFEEAEEHERTRGLGLLPGRVTRLDTRGGKLPHIGWNRVTLERPSPLTADLGEAAAFYHVHSFCVRPADPSDVVGTGEYGERFASNVTRGMLFGVQFHPEKSSRNGMTLLGNFARVCAAARTVEVAS